MCSVAWCDSLFIPFQEERLRLVRALNAVSEFRAGHFKNAITSFIDLNINPAKVVALYPESISGRLAVPREDWIPLFGGPRKESKSDTGSIPEHPTQEPGVETAPSSSSLTQQPRPPSPEGSVRDIVKTGLDAIVSAVKNEDETSSLGSRKKPPPKGEGPEFTSWIVPFIDPMNR